MMCAKSSTWAGPVTYTQVLFGSKGPKHMQPAGLHKMKRQGEQSIIQCMALCGCVTVSCTSNESIRCLT